MASSSSNPGYESEISRLFSAAESGNFPVFKRRVKEIQKLGLKIETVRDTNDFRTVFHVAAVAGSTQICRYLVAEEKVDVDLRDDIGRTPLEIAILVRNTQTVVYLLDKGADPNSKCNTHRTSLHYAVESGLKKLAQLVIKKGANVNAVSDMGTPLVHAAFRNHKDIVKLLLDNGADVNVFSYDLSTPLLSAIGYSSSECVKLLLEKGADPNLYGSRRYIPLSQAVHREDAEMIKSLLKAGADPNMTNAMGITPIEVAAVNKYLLGVMILFPETSRIPTIPEWTYAGIIKHSRSAEAASKARHDLNEYFLMSKSKGDEAFNKKDYYGAMKWYTEAYDCKPEERHTMSSEKSLCWACLNEGGLALSYAGASIALRPDWPKGYYRKGAAYMVLKQYEHASEAFHRAWTMEPQNKEFERAFSEAVEAQLSNVHIS